MSLIAETAFLKWENNEEQTSNEIRASQVNQHILLVDLTPDEN